MKLEIEKKYELSEYDYNLIKNNCTFVEDKEIKDYYLDMPDFRLVKAEYKLRLRNGMYELKIMDHNSETNLVTAQEIEDEDEINKLLEKFSCSTDDVTGILFIDTKRESFSTTFAWQDIKIDIDTYQHWSKYEIEIMQEVDDNISQSDKENIQTHLNTTINNFIEHLKLEAINNNSYKALECAMHQNIPLYEIMIWEQI